MSKIFDCFTYMNEDRILKLRLETLWDKIDYFVICESLFTHAGKPKPQNFKLKNFQKYKSKIRYLLIKNFPFKTNDPWKRESYQRDYLAKGLKDAKEGDLIIVSDIDEIPHPDSISKFNPKRYVIGTFVMLHFNYFINNIEMLNDKPNLWKSAKITSFTNYQKIFKNPHAIRHYKSKGKLRLFKREYIKIFRTHYLQNGGWHFSWMGSLDNIIYKIENFAHQEFNNEDSRNKKIIRQKIASGQNIVNPKTRFKAIEIDQQFPLYLRKHLNEFKDWILKK
jgi:beta-1,4-mannosyl-glycoprotein beta-1,4-N-acetylglucosaminyltransferase